MARKLSKRSTSARGCTVRKKGSCQVALGPEEGLGQLIQQGREVSTPHRGDQQQRRDVQG